MGVEKSGTEELRWDARRMPVKVAADWHSLPFSRSKLFDQYMKDRGCRVTGKTGQLVSARCLIEVKCVTLSHFYPTDAQSNSFRTKAKPTLTLCSTNCVQFSVERGMRKKKRKEKYISQLKAKTGSIRAPNLRPKLSATSSKGNNLYNETDFKFVMFVDAGELTWLVCHPGPFLVPAPVIGNYRAPAKTTVIATKKSKKVKKQISKDGRRSPK